MQGGVLFRLCHTVQNLGSESTIVDSDFLTDDADCIYMKNTPNNTPSFFTPHFLQAIDSVGGLGLLVDTSLMKSMLDERPVRGHLYECIREHGYNDAESMQNAAYLNSWIEEGVFTTRLSRSRYGFNSAINSR